MKHHDTPNHRAGRIGLALATTLGLAPATAHAQFAQRLSLSGHLGPGVLASDPQAMLAGVGGGAGLRPTLRVAGPLHVQLVADVELWPTRTAVQPLTPAVGILRLGGGLRFFHAINDRIGGPFVDADVAAAITTQPPRFSYAFGAGWLMPLGRWMRVGPVVRVGSALPPSVDPFNFGTFWYVTAGVEIELHIPPPRVSAPVPEPVVVRAAPPVDPDADRDGVQGAADRCPSAPETRNGHEDDDGCPDTPPPPPPPVQVAETPVTGNGPAAAPEPAPEPATTAAPTPEPATTAAPAPEPAAATTEEDGHHGHHGHRGQRGHRGHH